MLCILLLCNIDVKHKNEKLVFFWDRFEGNLDYSGKC